MAYATTTDLANYGLSQAALTNFTGPQQQAALQAASDEADSYLRSQFQLPLIDYDTSLTIKVCQVAAETLIMARGFNPDGADETYVLNAKNARMWFRDVAMGKAVPGITDSSSGSSPGVTSSTGPKLFSQPSRGFSRNPPRLGGGYYNRSRGGGIW